MIRRKNKLNTKSKERREKEIINKYAANARRVLLIINKKEQTEEKMEKIDNDECN